MCHLEYEWRKGEKIKCNMIGRIFFKKWILSQLLVFAFWLLSGSISGVLTAPGLIVLLFKKKKKKSLPLILNLQVFGYPAGREELGSLFFSFPVVPLDWRLSLGYSIHRCPVSSPHPQSTVHSTLSTLCICARQVLTIHLVLQPFDGSWGALSGSK